MAGLYLHWHLPVKNEERLAHVLIVFPLQKLLTEPNIEAAVIFGLQITAFWANWIHLWKHPLTSWLKLLTFINPPKNTIGQWVWHLKRRSRRLKLELCPADRIEDFKRARILFQLRVKTQRQEHMGLQLRLRRTLFSGRRMRTIGLRTAFVFCIRPQVQDLFDAIFIQLFTERMASIENMGIERAN